jgi:hypothetical protein
MTNTEYPDAPSDMDDSTFEAFDDNLTTFDESDLMEPLTSEVEPLQTV